MVPDEGIEPPTFGLQNRCSTAELIRRLFATRLPRTDQARAAYREIRTNSRRAQAEESLAVLYFGRASSYSAIAAALDTFKLSTLRPIGMRTIRSQCSRVSRRRP